MWGGRSALIVPTDGRSIGPLFWELLEAFDPDYVTCYHQTGLDWKLGVPAQYQDALERELKRHFGEEPATPEQRESIDEAMTAAEADQFGIEPELELELKRRLSPFFFEDSVLNITSLSARTAPAYPLTPISTIVPNCEHPKVLSLIEATIDAVPPLWVDAATGGSYPDYVSLLSQQGITVDKISFDESTLHGLFSLLMQAGGREQRDRTVRAVNRNDVAVFDALTSTPFAYSMLGLTQYRSVKDRGTKIPAVVVVGYTLEDFALYFNLSRLRSNVFWLLPDWVAAHRSVVPGGGPIPYAQMSPAEKSFGLFADIVLRGLNSSAFQHVAFLSNSHTAPQLEEARDKLDTASSYSRMRPTKPLQAHSSFPGNLNALVYEPEAVFNTDNFAVPTTQQVQEGKAAGFFPTPKPKGFTKIVPYDHRWITELRIDGHIYPRHPNLGEWLVQHHLLGSQDVRVGARGVCYSCPSPMYFGGDIDTILIRPQLYVPSGAQVFERLANSAGWVSKLSDKGFYARDTVSKFGSLEAAAQAFRNPRHYAVFTEFLKEKSNTGAAGKYLTSDKRRYLDFAGMEAALGNPQEALSFVDSLVGKGLLHRGLILKCDFCRTADWFSLADLDHGFTCKRCRRSQPILSRHALQAQEPKWYYQLDEIAYQGIRNDMHVPLLALDHLRKSSISFLYVDELEVALPGADHPFIEIDICCICDGVLTIGEAKVTDRIEGGGARERHSLQKYRDAAGKLGVRRFVYATSKAWLAQTHANVQSVFAGTAIETVPLTSHELYT